MVLATYRWRRLPLIAGRPWRRLTSVAVSAVLAAAAIAA
jgi:hypothetical protein